MGWGFRSSEPLSMRRTSGQAEQAPSWGGGCAERSRESWAGGASQRAGTEPQAIQSKWKQQGAHLQTRARAWIEAAAPL